MTLRFFCILLLVGALGACSAKRCISDTGYLDAKSTPPLQSADGYSVPPPDPAYQIPILPEDAAGATAATSAEKRAGCLDFPPPLDAPAEGAG